MDVSDTMDLVDLMTGTLAKLRKARVQMFCEWLERIEEKLSYATEDDELEAVKNLTREQLDVLLSDPDTDSEHSALHHASLELRSKLNSKDGEDDSANCEWRESLRALLEMAQELAKSDFDKWLDQYPNGPSKNDLVKLARKLCSKEDSGDGGDSDVELQTGEAAVDEDRLVSWEGVGVEWFLECFMRTTEAKRLLVFGCRMWFVRNFCVTEILRRMGIQAGAIVHHMDAWTLGKDGQSDQKPVSAPATAFVSYTGAYKLEHFTELISHEDLQGRYVWIDMFCVDQFAWTERKDDEMLAFKEAFMYQLSDKVGHIGYTALMLDRWDVTMATLDKIWVIWEMFSTVDGGATLRVLLREREKERFHEGLNSIGATMRVRESLVKIDANEAKSWDPEDKKLILGIMKKKNGVFKVNASVINRMRKWLVEAGQALYKEGREAGYDVQVLGNNLANTYRELSEFSKSMELHKEVLSVRRKELGEKHRHTLGSMSSLASQLENQGHIQEAEMLCREALEGIGETLGENHPDTLVPLTILAHIRGRQFKFEEQETLYRKVLSGYRERLGGKHHDTLGTMLNLAGALFAQEKFKEADQLFNEALDSLRQQLGDRHPKTLDAMNGLAAVLVTMGKYDEAESLCREALKGVREQHGNHREETVKNIYLLATVFMNQGKVQQAERICREGISTQQRLFGDKHISTLTLLDLLSNALQRQGKFSDAEQMSREALDGARSILGDKNPVTLGFKSTMAVSLQLQGRLDEAEQLHCELLNDRREALGDGHPDTLTSIYYTGSIMWIRGSGRSLALLQEAAIGCLSAFGPNHPMTQRANGTVNNVINVGRGQASSRENLRRINDMLSNEKRSVRQLREILNTAGVDIGGMLAKSEFVEAVHRLQTPGDGNRLNKEQDPSTMSGRELREFLRAAGVDTSRMLEKSEFVEAFHRIQGVSSAPQPCHHAEQNDTEEIRPSADPATISGRELRQILREADVDTSGMLEKAEFVEAVRRLNDDG